MKLIWVVRCVICSTVHNSAQPVPANFPQLFCDARQMCSVNTRLGSICRAHIINQADHHQIRWDSQCRGLFQLLIAARITIGHAQVFPRAHLKLAAAGGTDCDRAEQSRLLQCIVRDSRRVFGKRTAAIFNRLVPIHHQAVE